MALHRPVTNTPFFMGRRTFGIASDAPALCLVHNFTLSAFDGRGRA